MLLFPIFVKLEGRRCVVAGGGKIAAAKIASLLRYGARVTVVAPRASAWIQAQHRAGKLAWRKRVFQPRDRDRAFLVIAATDSPAVNRAVYGACAGRGVLCNVVDDPERCDFFYPAMVSRGELQIAISTGGSSPALARRLRRELQRQFGPEYAAWVAQVAKQRREILSRPLRARPRQRLLKQIAGRAAYQAFVRERARRRRRRKKAHG